MSTYDKASWRAQAVTRVHDQLMWFRHTVQAMTSNIKKIKGTTVNPKSSNYMFINKFESENMHRKRYGEHRYT